MVNKIEDINKFIKNTIKNLFSAINSYHPYTANHQKRVAAFACLIAKEIGLSDNAIINIHIASILHDIGKIHIPLKLLAKPTKLTDTEKDILKTHIEIGCNLLEDKGFPYPIVEIVHTHHERLNGSGYPQGLKDGEIQLESAILAVADVFEAMLSHRSYRPALGIEAALKEIEDNKGILYHPKVADACLKLFCARVW